MVDDIPVTVIEPRRDPRGVALWLPYLGGDKEVMKPGLDRLAAAGFVAASLDPWLHGARAREDSVAVRDRALGAFRRVMWSILGHTTLDALRVLDWLMEHAGVDSPLTVAGGLSMGGDVATALAGIDGRVRRIAAVGSTPDWSRPRMRSLDGTGAVVDQGEPTALSQWLYDQLDPIRHRDRFDDPDRAFLFVSGEDDDHVRVEAVRRFASAVQAQVTVRMVPGGHVASVRDDNAVTACLDWLVAP